MTQTVRRRLVIAVLILTVAGCGFRLRGEVALPFDSIYVQTPADSSFAAELTRYLKGGSKVKVVDSPAEAQVVLQVLSELREKQILTLTQAGTVGEFLLRYKVNFRLQSKDGRDLIAATDITLVRDYTFNSSQALAKEYEESLLYRDMQSDAVQQMLRRLQAAKI
ncbi:MAG TPA: LPS assembly lipoprotein LptE [Burkholderiales bacterium]|nr:LPS assembly lipoprotein LptE [Burkholderiales bacterium]